MSFKGAIEAKCPGGCEPFEAEIWSYVRGDQNPELREAMMAREFNLLLCPGCNKAFFPETAYVYFEPPAEILAFVFPDSYRDKEQYWRDKMGGDFIVMKQTLGKEISLEIEPELFFGIDDIGSLLDQEDWRRDERDVMEFIAKDLGLSIYLASPRFARKNEVPASLPYEGNEATRESVVAGLEKLLAANDRLTAYADCLERLKNGGELPPASTVKS